MEVTAMANLKITVDNEVLERARLRAHEAGTSVNAMRAEHLARFADPFGPQQRGLREISTIADRATKADLARARRRGGRRWTREELHER